MPTLRSIHSLNLQAMECEKNLAFEIARRRKIKQELKKQRLTIISYLQKKSWDEMVRAVTKTARFQDEYLICEIIKEMFEQS